MLWGQPGDADRVGCCGERQHDAEDDCDRDEAEGEIGFHRSSDLGENGVTRG